MTILSTDPAKKEILMGAYVNRRVHSYMTLYTLAKGMSKSKVFNMLLLDWTSRQKEVDTDVALLNEIVVRVQKARDRAKKRGVEMPIFKEAIEKELLAKGLSHDYIAIILQEII